MSGTNSAGSTKKEDIIRASIEVFVNEGFDRPSMDSIASHAQVSKRTLYKYFPSKRDLLDEILIYLIKEKQTALQFNVKSGTSVDRQLEELITQKAKLMLCPNSLKLAKIILSEFLKDEGFLKEHIETVLKSEKASLAWIQQAQEADQLKKDHSPIQILETLTELIHGFIFFPVLFGRKKGFSEDDVKKIVDMFLHLYRLEN